MKSRFYISVVGGQDYPTPRIIATVRGVKAAEAAVRSIFTGRAPYHPWTGAAQVCLLREREGRHVIVGSEARIKPDRCYALTPRGKITRV